MVKHLQEGGCVDEYLQDQLIIYMALAKGQSTLLTGPISLHTQTAIFVAEQMTQATFIVKPLSELTNLITCEGSGLTNPHYQEFLNEGASAKTQLPLMAEVIMPRKSGGSGGGTRRDANKRSKTKEKDKKARQEETTSLDGANDEEDSGSDEEDVGAGREDLSSSSRS